MAIARGQISFVDLNDGKSINLFLSSNQPTTQLYDVDQLSYTPNYTTSPYLVITPEVFVSGMEGSRLSNLHPTTPVTWKINGVAVTNATANVVIGDLSADYALTIKRNITDGTTMNIECTVIFVDPETSAETTAKSVITFTKVTTTAQLIRAIAYAPRGTIFKNNELDYLLLHCDMWRGSQIDSTNVTYQWYRRDNTDTNGGVDDGTWQKIVASVSDAATEEAAGNITGYTTNELKVPASDVLNYDVFMCVCKDTDSSSQTYNETCSDVISIFDMTDPYLVEFEFPAGTTLTQGMDSTTGTVYLWQNGTRITSSTFYNSLTYTWTKYTKLGVVDTSAKYANASGTSTDGNWTDGVATIAGSSGRNLTVYRDEVHVAATYAVEISETPAQSNS